MGWSLTGGRNPNSDPNPIQSKPTSTSMSMSISMISVFNVPSKQMCGKIKKHVSFLPVPSVTVKIEK